MAEPSLEGYDTGSDSDSTKKLMQSILADTTKYSDNGKPKSLFTGDVLKAKEGSEITFKVPGEEEGYEHVGKIVTATNRSVHASNVAGASAKYLSR